MPVGWKATGDVAGVAVQLAARINEHDFATAQWRAARAVVQHASIGTCGNDVAVSGYLRPVAAKLVQQLCFKVVFTRVLPSTQHGGTGLHGADVRLGADLGGLAQDGDFVRVFYQAHFIKCAASVVQRAWRCYAVAHAGAYLVYPACNAGIKPLVRGKGVKHAAGVFKQLG